MTAVEDRLAEIAALANAATEGPWEVGDNDIVAGVIGDEKCAYCNREGEPSWVGRRNINGRVMLAHVHQRPSWDDDTSVYAKRVDGSVVVALSTSEYVTIDATDAAFIAAARTNVPALTAALRAVLAVHAPNGMPVSRCTFDRLLYNYCPTVRAITAALGVTR